MYYSFPSITFAVSLSGNFKTYPTIKDFPQNKNAQKLLTNSAKIQINETLPKEVKFELSYELTTSTEKTHFKTNTDSNYRIDDLNLLLHHEATQIITRQKLLKILNRFNFNVTTSIGDLSIGRMPLAFGASKSISPNDVLTPIAINSIDKEERTGVDLFLIKSPLTTTIPFRFWICCW